MAVADKFVKNLKVLLNKRTLSEDEVKLVLLTVQETATLSAIEIMSLIDNMEMMLDEAQVEMGDAEMEEIKKELVEE